MAETDDLGPEKYGWRDWVCPIVGCGHRIAGYSDAGIEVRKEFHFNEVHRKKELPGKILNPNACEWTDFDRSLAAPYHIKLD